MNVDIDKYMKQLFRVFKYIYLYVPMNRVICMTLVKIF